MGFKVKGLRASGFSAAADLKNGRSNRKRILDKIPLGDGLYPGFGR
jgi:hypothetical protein